MSLCGNSGSFPDSPSCSHEAGVLLCLINQYFSRPNKVSEQRSSARRIKTVSIQANTFY